MTHANPHTRKRTPAVGHKDARFPEHTQIVVRFEDELFEILRRRATAQNTSFGEQVRILVEWGLGSESEAA